MIEGARELEQMIMAEPNVMDNEDVHHELAGGGHGRKLSLNNIPEDSQTYKHLIKTEAEAITALYDTLPNVIIGMANSANRIARDVSEELNGSVEQVVTEKNSFGYVIPTYAGKVLLKSLNPDFALIVDVGTTGGTVAKFVEKLAIKYSIPRVEVLFTWQRQPTLTILQNRGIAHNAIIDTELKTYYSAKECLEDREGYCHNNTRLIKRESL